MVLFIILGVVVLITFVVLGVLFFMLGKEGQKKKKKGVPVTDLNQLKKELSSGLFERINPRSSEEDSEIIPAFEPKVSLPTQEAVSLP